MITAVVLAAGGSVRLGGRPKQLLQVDGRPLVARVLAAVLESQVRETVVVTGYRADEVRAAGRPALAGAPGTTPSGGGKVGDGLAVRWVENPGWAGGMSTSLKAGLAAIAPEASGVLVVLADQPFLSPALINRLIAAFTSAPGPVIVRPACAGHAGHPVLLGRPFLGALQAAQGDEGGRAALSAFSRHIVTVPAAEWEIMDVDTWEDAARCGASWI